MDAFIKATTFQYSAFLKSGNGDTWRVWFGNEGSPWIERSINDQVPREVESDFTDAASLRSIAARARLVIKEWRAYGGDIKPPIVDQLEALEELFTAGQTGR